MRDMECWLHWLLYLLERTLFLSVRLGNLSELRAVLLGVLDTKKAKKLLPLS